jgi:CBS domain-containing protein
VLHRTAFENSISDKARSIRTISFFKIINAILEEILVIEREHSKETRIPFQLELSDEDIFDAMKQISGYLDITPGDFKEIYGLAFQHAINRFTRAVEAKKEVAETMGRHGISGVPVVDEGQMVVGIISEKDFLSHMGVQKNITFMSVVAECLIGNGCMAVDIRGKSAGDIMTSPAITVYEDTSIMEVDNRMRNHRINRVPVLNQMDKLSGIVTRTDLLPSSCITAIA